LEAEKMNQDTLATPRRSPAMNAKVALFVVLACETFFFGTVLSAYVFLRTTTSGWPALPAPLSQIIIPIANTLLLGLSVIPMAWVGKAVARGKQRAAQGWLSLVLVMGLIFIAGQVFEFNRSGMSPSDQAFGGVFFTLMGFHALHIVAGIIMLVMLTIRTRLGDFTRRRHVAIDVGAWFWYYVVAVWVVLFAALYLF
jgi:cytochrome c oxidase subunit III